MEIAWFTDTWLPTRDGVVNSLLSFKKVLEKEHNIYIFAPSKKNERDKNIFYFKSRAYSKYPDYRIASLLPIFSKKVAKIVRELEIDIIHSHSPGVIGTYAVTASHFNSLPLIFTYHTFIQDSVYFFSEGMQNFTRKMLNIWLKWYFRRCNAVIAPSNYVAGKLKKFHNKIEVIPTGIDVKRFENGNGEKLKERYQKPIILHVGRIVREKNIDLLIEAFPLINKKVDAVVLIGGEGPYKKELIKKVEKRGLQKSIIFTGFIKDEELPNYYNAASVFAFPSTYETQGIVALEAMAAGTPVVAARARAIPEFVIDGETGYLFEAGNEKELAEKIVMAIENGSMREKCREHAKKYDIVKMAERLVKFYEVVSKN